MADNTDSAYDEQKIKDRIANIQGSVAQIKVSAPTETDSQEIKYRVEDAINAVRSAMQEGIVPGGGVALRDIQKEITDELIKDLYPEKQDEFYVGFQIVVEAIKQPFYTILENAGIEDVVKFEKGKGFNVETGLEVDMMEEGVIDPAKVVRTALINAASISGVFVTTAAAITINREDSSTDKILKAIQSNSSNTPR